MTLVARFELILLLMVASILLDLAARRLRMPPAAALILGGLALALVPGMPALELDPDLTLVLILPPLLMASAYFTVWREFRANIRIILQLAIGAVALTTVGVGVVAHWMVPTLPWAACFALGAIVAPPDAVAAKAVLQRLSLPRRMVVLLEGESLVNDASGLVLYRFAVVAALTGAFDAGEAAIGFVAVSVGGIAAGVASGLVAIFVIARLREPVLVVIASLLVAWGSYILGEAVHVSGVLSTVACGLIMGWKQHDVLTAETRTEAKGVWGVVVFALESLVFILIGLSLRGVVERIGGDGWAVAASFAPAAAAIVAAVILTRFLWIFPAVYLSRAVSVAFRRHDPTPPVAVPIVMSWAGMRGVVSLAAALALPEQFPGRDFILAATFIVILVTVLVQGATLAPLIRLLRLTDSGLLPVGSLPEASARARVAAAALAEVERLARAEDGTVRHPRLLEQYAYRARAAARFSEASDVLESHRAEHFSVVLAAVTAARTEILRLHRSGEVHDSVLHALERELDLEEMSAKRFVSEASASA